MTLSATALSYLTVGPTLVNGLGGIEGFGEQTLARNDDGSSAAIDITGVFGAGGLNFFGTGYTSLYVNNNGNLTFAASSSTFTPSGIGAGLGNPIIAAFWADVDTLGGVGTATAGGNSTGANLVHYDLDAANGAFTATWNDVGYYDASIDKLNAFQIQLLDEGNGDFDIVLRYEALNWTTGDASGGSNGLGGLPARAGYSAGDGLNAVELAESGDQAAMLALPSTLGNAGLNGLWVYHVMTAAAGDSSITGSSGDDIVSGSSGANSMLGAGGADDLRGLDGDDLLLGGTDKDTLSGGLGDDTLSGGMNEDVLYGGQGNDLYFCNTGRDQVIELAGEGTDTVVAFASFTLPDEVEVLQLADGHGPLYGIGNTLDNVLLGNESANVLLGGNGADSIVGGDGDDVLWGQAGNDTLVGGDGANRLRGGAHDDTYIVTSAADMVLEAPGEGDDTVIATLPGGAGNAYFMRANIETLIFAGSADNRAQGNGGDNAITGNAGANLLLGGAGADTLTGGAGDDVLWGQADADVFAFQTGDGADQVSDFTRGSDRILLIGTSLATFGDVQTALSDTANGVVLTIGAGDTVLLRGVTIAALSAGDFAFA